MVLPILLLGFLTDIHLSLAQNILAMMAMAYSGIWTTHYFPNSDLIRWLALLLSSFRSLVWWVALCRLPPQHSNICPRGSRCRELPSFHLRWILASISVSCCSTFSASFSVSSWIFCISGSSSNRSSKSTLCQFVLGSGFSYSPVQISSAKPNRYSSFVSLKPSNSLT